MTSTIDLPDLTVEFHSFGFALPLPKRVSNGFFVEDEFKKAFIQILDCFLNERLKVRRIASNCLLLILADSSTIKEKYPRVIGFILLFDFIASFLLCCLENLILLGARSIKKFQRMELNHYT